MVLGWLVGMLVGWFYGISILFGSFKTESNHFDKNFVLVWFGLV